MAMEDAPAVLSMRSDPRVMEHVARPLATSLEDAVTHVGVVQRSLAANEGIAWTITLKDDPAMIGTIGFWRINKEHHRGEVGYMMLPEHWNKGLMTEALNVVVHHGFHALMFHSIEAITDPRNTASRRLLEKNGFVLEAHFKENFLWKGEYLDSTVYAMLAPR